MIVVLIVLTAIAGIAFCAFQESREVAEEGRRGVSGWPAGPYIVWYGDRSVPPRGADSGQRPAA